MNFDQNSMAGTSSDFSSLAQRRASSKPSEAASEYIKNPLDEVASLRRTLMEDEDYRPTMVGVSECFIILLNIHMNTCIKHFSILCDTLHAIILWYYTRGI
jgi:hypothetical protein